MLLYHLGFLIHFIYTNVFVQMTSNTVGDLRQSAALMFLL